ncbi:hypothetical protein BC940DRAFT_300852 [Gongronella butleri]|nr:hypothetical protein BC940DRAFT_300852 [Gongronella butleri]
MSEKRQTKATQERHERLLNDLLKVPGNEYCADCKSRNPRWASFSLGVFLCVRCAGFHRKMGTHISRVKSISMDQWTMDQIESMRQAGGNIKVNNRVNPNPSKHPLPLADDEGHGMEKYIREKWEKRAYMDVEVSRPRIAAPPARAASAPIMVTSSDKSYREMRAKLQQMGFTDDQKNLTVLRQTQGNVDAAVHVLSRLDNGRQTSQDMLTLEQKLVQLRNLGYTDMDKNRQVLQRTAGNVDVAVTVLKNMKSSAVSSGPPPPPKEPNLLLDLHGSAATSSPLAITPSPIQQQQSQLSNNAAPMANSVNFMQQSAMPAANNAFAPSLMQQQQQQQQQLSSSFGFAPSQMSMGTLQPQPFAQPMAIQQQQPMQQPMQQPQQQQLNTFMPSSAPMCGHFASASPLDPFGQNSRMMASSQPNLFANASPATSFAQPAHTQPQQPMQPMQLVQQQPAVAASFNPFSQMPAQQPQSLNAMQPQPVQQQPMPFNSLAYMNQQQLSKSSFF